MRLVMWVEGVVLGEGITNVQYTEYVGITGEQEQVHFGDIFLPLDGRVFAFGIWALMFDISKGFVYCISGGDEQGYL